MRADGTGATDMRTRWCSATTSTTFPLIKIDVRHRGGQPVIQGRNVRASTIAELVAAGESREDVAEWYALSTDQIDQTVGYYRRHLRIA